MATHSATHPFINLLVCPFNKYVYMCNAFSVPGAGEVGREKRQDCPIFIVCRKVQGGLKLNVSNKKSE